MSGVWIDEFGNRHMPDGRVIRPQDDDAIIRPLAKRKSREKELAEIASLFPRDFHLRKQSSCYENVRPPMMRNSIVGDKPITYYGEPDDD